MFQLSFLNSGFLALLSTAVIPILIYLFAKRRPDKLVFSSLMFLKQITKQQTKRITIKNIILLIIRILIIALSVLAISRPAVRHRIFKASDKHPPTAIVMIIDNSYSMDYLESEITNLEKAKENAQKINSILTVQDYCAVLTFDSGYNGFISDMTQGKVNSKSIESIDPVSDIIDFNTVLEKAYYLLDKVHLPNKEIVVFSDLQSNVYTDNMIKDIPVNFVRISNTERQRNISCSNAHISYRYVDRNRQKEVVFSITNHSDQDMEDQIYRLIVNQQTIQERSVSLKAGQTRELSLPVRFERNGWYNGYVEVNDERLPFDNKTYFSFYNKMKQDIAVICRSKKDVPLPIKTILNIYSGSKSNIKYISNVNSENLKSISSYDVVVLYNPNYSTKLSALMKEMKNNGKSFMFFSGEQLDQQWKSELSDIFSVNIGDYNDKELFITEFNNYHEITKIISQDKEEHQIHGYFSAISGNSNVLAGSGTNPLVLEKSNSILWLIDFSNKNNTLVYDKVFPVMLFRSAQMQNSEAFASDRYRVGDKLRGIESITLPDGNTITERELILKDAGIYRLNGNSIDNISVNIDKKESTFMPVDSLRLEKIDVYGNDWFNNVLHTRYGYELWRIIVLIVLALFLLEMLIVKNEERKTQ